MYKKAPRGGKVFMCVCIYTYIYMIYFFAHSIKFESYYHYPFSPCGFGEVDPQKATAL